MKKILVLTLSAILALLFLTGCSNAVYDDFENFVNMEMTEVNENYSKIQEEIALWGDVDDTQLIEVSIEDIIFPLIDDSLTKLDNINPETEEVKAVKDKYVKVMEVHREGFELFLTAVQENDMEIMNRANDKITEGVELLEEYNTALEELAKEVGAEVEY